MGKDLKGRELGSGIRQNKDGRYEARYVDRFQKRHSIYSYNKADVKDKLRKAVEEDQQKKSVRKRLTSLNG